MVPAGVGQWLSLSQSCGWRGGRIESPKTIRVSDTAASGALSPTSQNAGGCPEASPGFSYSQRTCTKWAVALMLRSSPDSFRVGFRRGDTVTVLMRSHIIAFKASFPIPKVVRSLLPQQSVCASWGGIKTSESTCKWLHSTQGGEQIPNVTKTLPNSNHPSCLTKMSAKAC